MSVESSVPQGGIEGSGPSGRAVFLSYASQDADAARRIAEALRAAGVEVWFDVEGELVGGDAWDHKVHPSSRFDRPSAALKSANASPTFASCRETRSH